MKNDFTKPLSDIDAIPQVLFQSYVLTHNKELTISLKPPFSRSILEELREIKRQLKRPITPIQRYAKTKHAAAYLDVDPSYLTKRMGIVFVEGLHYFYPENESIVRWDLEQLHSWLRSEEQEGDTYDFLSSIEL